MNKRNIIIIVSVLAFLVIVGGVSYSYFVYNKDVGDVSVTAGEISISLSGVNGNQSLTGIVPMSDTDGINSSNYFDFTVNSTVDTEKIYYEVYISPKTGNTLNTNYIKTYLTDQNNNKVSEITMYNDLSDYETNGKIIYKGLVTLNSTKTKKNETKALRLRVWLDETFTESTAKTFEFDINLHAYNVDDVWAENVSYGNDENCDTVQCQLDTLAGA